MSILLHGHEIANESTNVLLYEVSWSYGIYFPEEKLELIRELNRRLGKRTVKMRLFFNILIDTNFGIIFYERLGSFDTNSEELRIMKLGHIVTHLLTETVFGIMVLQAIPNWFFALLSSTVVYLLTVVLIASRSYRELQRQINTDANKPSTNAPTAT